MAVSENTLSRSAVLGMVAMGVAVLVIANDFTALSVALPAMEKSFGIDLTTAQWVINGYAMVFGIFIVTGGRLADMYGRRRIFFIGSGVFATFSVIGGLAPEIWLLLLCRALMGLGGAMMWPAILGMTYGLLPRNKAGLAGGLILGAAGIGNALGPLFGGILTDSIGWRWVFLINLPIAVVAALITWKVVRADDSGTVREPIDYRGMTAMCLGLFALLLALDEGTSRGWTNGFILACFAVAAVSLVAFALIERRAGPKALVPDDVIANRTFLMAGLSVLMMSAIFFAALLYLPQFMSKQLGFSAVGSGAGLLPMMGTFALTSFIAGMLYERLGAKLTVSSGAALLAGGMFLLSRVDSGTSYADMVPGMVVLGLGVGLFYSSITTTAITALDPARSSLAGAIVYMLQIAGGSLGLGLNTAIVVTASSLAEGIRHAFLFDGILALAGLVLSLVFAPGKKAGARVEATPHRHRAHH